MITQHDRALNIVFIIFDYFTEPIENQDLLKFSYETIKKFIKTRVYLVNQSEVSPEELFLKFFFRLFEYIIAS